MKRGNWAGHAPRRINHDLLIELYRQGIPVLDIATRMGCSRRRVYRIIKTNQVPTRRRHYANLTQQIVQMMRQGTRQMDIAAILGVSTSTISYYARQAGYGKRKHGPKRQPVKPPPKPTMRRRCPDCYAVTMNPTCPNGHTVYEEVTEEA